ncbi:tail fiber assembly protein [Pseudomonas reactans]|nr:tail fiber assembly protein [Pseudomonas reactans]
MAIFFSAKQNLFFNDEFHGTRMISVADPAWVRPTVKASDPKWTPPDIEVKNPAWSEGAEDVPETIFVPDLEAKPPTIDIPDESASAPLIEVTNPKCLLPPEAELVEVSAAVHDAIYRALATSPSVVSSDSKGYPITIPAPGQTPEQILAGALIQRDRLITLAATRIAPLRAAVDLGDATEDDAANLTKWMRYQVAVNRVPDQAGFPDDIVWPLEPS